MWQVPLLTSTRICSSSSSFFSCLSSQYHSLYLQVRRQLTIIDSSAPSRHTGILPCFNLKSFPSKQGCKEGNSRSNVHFVPVVFPQTRDVSPTTDSSSIDPVTTSRDRVQILGRPKISRALPPRLIRPVFSNVCLSRHSHCFISFRRDFPDLSLCGDRSGHNDVAFDTILTPGYDSCHTHDDVSDGGINGCRRLEDSPYDGA